MSVANQSQESSLDSQNASPTESPLASPSQGQTFIRKVRVSNRHLNHAQMRGVVQLFRHYFPKRGKRLTKEERDEKWATYKRRIYAEYGRLVTGKLSSEKALVKRYSEPLLFLKYKLKRHTNLKVSDLSTKDQTYYHEIGGEDDVEAMMRKIVNIDNVNQMSQSYKSSKAGRKRRRIDNAASKKASNHNRRLPVNADNTNSQAVHGQDSMDFLTHVSVPELSILGLPAGDLPPIHDFALPELDDRNHDDLTPALRKLSEKMDIFQKEQLGKKKLETFALTMQKMSAVKTSIEKVMNREPHLIGVIPDLPADCQKELALKCWVQQHKHLILTDPAIRGEIKVFVTQLTVLQANKGEFETFLTRWAWMRIFHDNHFEPVWRDMKDALGIIDAMSEAGSNDKAELDDDGKNHVAGDDDQEDDDKEVDIVLD